MKKIILFLFVIFVNNLYSENNLEYNINSTFYSSKSIDYIVGDVVVGLDNYRFSTTTIPLANLIDSTLGIYCEENLKFKVLPNPVNSFFIFSVEVEGNYEINLLDITGKKIATIFNNWVSVNTETLVNIEHLKVSSGNYILLLTCNFMLPNIETLSNYQTYINIIINK